MVVKKGGTKTIRMTEKELFRRYDVNGFMDVISFRAYVEAKERSGLIVTNRKMTAPKPRKSIA